MREPERVKCQRCGSERIVVIQGKLTAVSFDLGYKEVLPQKSNLGYFNELSFDYCLECGQVQGDFPEEVSKLELS